jgi:hypothetical protein
MRKKENRIALLSTRLNNEKNFLPGRRVKSSYGFFP